MGLPRRGAPAGPPTPPEKLWVDPQFNEEFPALMSFLKDQRYDDGTARKTGSISVFTKGGLLTIAVNDNDRNLTAFVSAATWTEALFIIDEGIGNDSLDWKAKTYSQPQQKPPF